jgi:hypothetical protein
MSAAALLHLIAWQRRLRRESHTCNSGSGVYYIPAVGVHVRGGSVQGHGPAPSFACGSKRAPALDSLLQRGIPLVTCPAEGTGNGTHDRVQ